MFPRKRIGQTPTFIQFWYLECTTLEFRHRGNLQKRVAVSQTFVQKLFSALGRKERYSLSCLLVCLQGRQPPAASRQLQLTVIKKSDRQTDRIELMFRFLLGIFLPDQSQRGIRKDTEILPFFSAKWISFPFVLYVKAWWHVPTNKFSGASLAIQPWCISLVAIERWMIEYCDISNSPLLMLVLLNSVVSTGRCNSIYCTHEMRTTYRNPYANFLDTSCYSIDI
jgi:hypothetical protein